MSEVKRYHWAGDHSDGIGYGCMYDSVESGTKEMVGAEDFDRVTAELQFNQSELLSSRMREKELQARLTAADERAVQAETIIRKWKEIFGESMARRSELYVMTDAFLSELKPAEGGGDA